MTKFYVVAVYDRMLDAFGRPFFVPAIGAAIRGFQDEINRPESEMFKHPDDYDLFELGTWSDEDGKFFNLDEPKQAAIGKQMKVNSEGEKS